MKRCAFLSMDNLDDFEVYDELLYEPLKNRGWEVDEVSWRNEETDWDQYDAVIIRTPWDYQDAPKAFIEVLKDIDASSAILENSLDTVKWNIDKRYLQDLHRDGIEIVPTLWKDEFHKEQLPSFFDELETDEIVVKPTISAGADNTYWIKQKNQSEYLEELAEVFEDRPFLVQPFMQNIVEEGEFSVFFFGDTYSHTILKTPKTDDFRVQEEHGGRLNKVEPEKSLLTIARKTLNNITPLPLYTRADYVRTAKNSFALMELELIEPSLYFNMDPESPERFADVFDEWMNKRLTGTT
ncbi:ATP-grasp domain-containing protein [Fodinibius halophilus]|uniref:Prokaryotic glutathione synthetase ATP-binding domain-containing protein n=1 Tax=Fodinibius halophilus TaxID=1736908 RepID=A0A6M1SYR6_9BACT|nr:hypothetical protein [Fodinibius halophilus]NGP86787.1 hypothetical protein [Fodinibius halophilus]